MRPIEYIKLIKEALPFVMWCGNNHCHDKEMQRMCNEWLDKRKFFLKKAKENMTWRYVDIEEIVYMGEVLSVDGHKDREEALRFFRNKEYMNNEKI